MRHLTTIVCIALVLAASSAAAMAHKSGRSAAANAKAATPPDRAHAAIAQLEQDWLAALRQHDSTALERILADDYVDVSTQGDFTGKPDQLSGSPMPPDVEQNIRDLRVRVYGDTAIATGVNVIQSHTQGWTAEVAFTDVFHREKGAWRAVSSQETLRPQGPTSPP